MGMGRSKWLILYMKNDFVNIHKNDVSYSFPLYII